MGSISGVDRGRKNNEKVHMNMCPI